MQILKAWLKIYFTKTSLLVLIPLNILIGAVASAGFFIAILFIFGFFNSDWLIGFLLGCGILIAIVLLFFVANYICYRICKFVGHYKDVEESAKRGKVGVKAVIVITVFILVAISFLFPDSGLFLFFNGWWF